MPAVGARSSGGLLGFLLNGQCHNTLLLERRGIGVQAVQTVQVVQSN
jgi:hypothetical protein